MKSAAYIGTILPDGHLSIEPETVRRLGLKPNKQVQVVLIPVSKLADDEASKEAQRQAVWQQVEEVRQAFSGMNFRLTDSLIQAREEEDASL